MEVYYLGAWGTVCDDDWDIKDAEVVCRQLGYTSATAERVGAYFGKGRGAILLDDVRCNGNEESLSQCKHNGWGVTDCNHYEDAGVSCHTNDIVTSLNTGKVGTNYVV